MSTKKLSKEAVGFTSAMDWWVAVVVFLILALLAVCIPLAIWKGGSLITSGLSVIFLVALFLLIADKAFFTSYVLREDGLLIHGQIRKILIPYRSMRSITKGGILGLMGGMGRKRFALSSDCLIIQLADYEWKRISVSPCERERFLSELLTRIDGERSARSSRRKA